MSHSNIGRFCASLDALKNILDFTRDGLGGRILDQQAARVLDRAAAQRGPKSKWAKNRGEYGERKRAKGLPVGVGLESSAAPMLSAGNVRGERDITPGSASMAFGADDTARRKGQWFTNGSTGTDGERSGAENQPPRPFYEMNRGDAKAIRAECEQAVDRVLKGA